MLLLQAGLSIVTLIFFNTDAVIEANEICPNITQNVSMIDVSTVEGLWYLYSARPNILEQDSKCIFANITYYNGTAYIRRFETLRSTNQLKIADGYVTSGPKPGQLSFHYITPIEFNHTDTILGGPVDSHVAVFNCLPCSNLSPNDVGVHPYIWTRVRKPNCTVNTNALEIFSSFNISTDALSQIEQDDCTI